MNSSRRPRLESIEGLSFLGGRRGQEEVPALARSLPATEFVPAPSPASPPLIAAAREEEPLSRRGPRTTVRFDPAEILWLNELKLVALRQGERERVTQDVLIRALVRAVHELAPQIDLSGIGKDDEEELVARIKRALLEVA